MLLVLVLTAANGCKKKSKGDSDPDGDSGNPITRNIGNPKQPATNDIQRGAEKQVDQNALREIAKVYIQFELENNRTPATVDELLGAMRGFPAQHINMLKDGWLVMVPNARLTPNTIILYEKNVYQKWNNRVVAFGDGHVATMSDPDFQAALNGRGQ
jgi:hypothetical protein